MKNKIKYFIYFFIFLLIISCSKSTDNYFKVIKILDGDTIEIDYNGKIESVRYIGINTPEIAHQNKEAEIYGYIAKEENEKLLKDKKVRLEFDVEERDKYGRLLAYVYLPDGRMVNNELIKNGFAYIFTLPPNVKYTDLFKKSQEEAREKELGLWSKNVIPEINAENLEELYKNIGKFVKVRGKVLKTYKSKKVTYLNFGKNYKKDFSVVIFSNNYENFKNDPEKYYLYKKVNIYGKLKEYNGPEIIVNSDDFIEVIE